MKDTKKTSTDHYNDDDRKRLARILMRSRAESGMSQEKVSIELGIAKKTVQNWERGVSAPTLPQAVAWFQIMRIPAMPYLLQYIFPDMEGITKNESDEMLREELINLIKSMPPDGIRQLMYLFYGNHGSSPRAVLNLVTAHLQTPLRERFSHAYSIFNDYRISLELGDIVRPDHIQPNIDILKQAMLRCRRAILQKKSSYTLVKDEHPISRPK